MIKAWCSVSLSIPVIFCAGERSRVPSAPPPVCLFICSEWAEDSLEQKPVCAPPSHLCAADGNLLPRWLCLVFWVRAPWSLCAQVRMCGWASVHARSSEPALVPIFPSHGAFLDVRRNVLQVFSLQSRTVGPIIHSAVELLLNTVLSQRMPRQTGNQIN